MGLKKLTDLLKGKADVLLVPSVDAHGSEYLAAADKRRSFISGFTGSAGWAVITQKEALLWTDGRYYLQASQQLPKEWQLMKFGQPSTPSNFEWITQNYGINARVAFDEQLTSIKELLDMESKFQLVPLKDNPIDEVWEGQPLRKFNEIFVLPVKYAGQEAAEKLARLTGFVQEKQADGYMITSLDEVAWMLNLRGSDIEFNPFFFSYLFVSSDQSVLFSNATLSADVKKHLDQLKVHVLPYDGWRKYLQQFSKKVICSELAHVGVYNAVGGKEKCVPIKSPIQMWKAIKNEVELEGFRQCHIQDAAALCMYFGWLENELTNRKLNEIEAADKAEKLRYQMKDFVSLSFDTISSVGANGAIIHYKPERSTCATLDVDQIYLCDSGGQYMNGTTDVTRSLYFGKEPQQKYKHAFTTVLKSHVQLSIAKFPPGTTGYRLDVIARSVMNSQGMDYRHGTGHGVGHVLGVHEGPHSIANRKSADEVGLVEGMTATIEPGFYLDGEFGIRIENVVLVQKANGLPYNFGLQDGETYLQFEAATFVPYGQKLIDSSMLTKEELEFITNYHKQCLQKVKPVLEAFGGEDAKLGLVWLQRETQPIS